jgi:WD40 repeat protein
LLSLSNGNLANIVNNKISIWDTVNFVLLRKLIGHNQTITRIAELPDGALVSGSKDKTIKIWNINDSTVKYNFEQTKSIVDIAVLQNGNIVIGFFGSIKILDSTLAPVNNSFDVYLPIAKIIILQDQDHVVTAFRNQIYVFDINYGKIKKIFNTTKSIENLASLNNGFITTFTNQVHKWDINNGLKENFTIDSGNLNAIVVNPNGKLVCGTSYEIQVWNENSLEQKVYISSFITSLAILKNGNLASADFNKILIYDF